MQRLIVTNNFLDEFSEVFDELDKDNLATIMYNTPIEQTFNFFNEIGTNYAKVNLKETDYFIAYKFDDDKLILLSLLDEERFLSKQIKEINMIFYSQIPNINHKRKAQYGSNCYRKNPLAKTKDGRFKDGHA